MKFTVLPMMAFLLPLQGALSQPTMDIEKIRTDEPVCVEAILNGQGLEISERTLSMFEVRQQENLSDISFPMALDLAIQSWLNNGHHIESPLSILEDHGNGQCVDGSRVEKLKCFMNKPGTYLGLVPLDSDGSGNSRRIFPPEHGESLEENWVFYLQIPALSDHLYWAVIDRTTGHSYNYGFN